MKLLNTCAVWLLLALGTACAMPASEAISPHPAAVGSQGSPAGMQIRVLSVSADSLASRALGESEEPAEPSQPLASGKTMAQPNEAPTETAVVRVNDVGVVGRTFQRGEIVTVTKEENGFCTVEAEDGVWLVESWLLRRSDAPAPKAYVGYARGGAEVFSDPYLEGDALATLSVNTKVTVADAFGTLLRVTLADGSKGYVRAAQISRNRISSGSSGSGSSGGQDGGDIPLSARSQSGFGIVTLGLCRPNASKPFAPSAAMILADGVEGYLAVCAAEDTLQVLEKGEDRCTVIVGEQTGAVQTDLLRFQEDPPYKQWNGFAKSKAQLHRQHRLLDEAVTLKRNTAVRVMGELGDLYLVEVNGEIGFLPRDQVSRTKISGGSSGGSGGDWTAPVL